MSEIIGRDADRTIAVINFTVSADGDELNLIDVWSIPDGVDSHQINEALSAAIDGCQPLIEAAEHTWNGVHRVLYHGQTARNVLIMLMPTSAAVALRERYSAWAAGEREEGPTHAAELSRRIVDTLRMRRSPDRWELSRALSRHGLMLSLFEERTDEALAALEDAIERGPGDGWVTPGTSHTCSLAAANTAALPTRSTRSPTPSANAPTWSCARSSSPAARPATVSSTSPPPTPRPSTRCSLR